VADPDPIADDVTPAVLPDLMVPSSVVVPTPVMSSEPAVVVPAVVVPPVPVSRAPAVSRGPVVSRAPFVSTSSTSLQAEPLADVADVDAANGEVMDVEVTDVEVDDHGVDSPGELAAWTPSGVGSQWGSSRVPFQVAPLRRVVGSIPAALTTLQEDAATGVVRRRPKRSVVAATVLALVVAVLSAFALARQPPVRTTVPATAPAPVVEEPGPAPHPGTWVVRGKPAPPHQSP
jgi:hypothetical protein